MSTVRETCCCGASFEYDDRDAWLGWPEAANRWRGTVLRILGEQGTRLFQISDELALRALLDWSEPLQVRLEKRDDGMYDLVARAFNPEPVAGDSNRQETGPSSEP